MSQGGEIRRLRPGEGLLSPDIIVTAGSHLKGQAMQTSTTETNQTPPPSIVLGMIKNTATGKFHPYAWRLAPFPGNVTRPARYKSIGHHTAGFDTLDDAKAYNDGRVTAIQTDGLYTCEVLSDDEITEWDGEGVPAGVIVR